MLQNLFLKMFSTEIIVKWANEAKTLFDEAPYLNFMLLAEKDYVAQRSIVDSLLYEMQFCADDLMRLELDIKYSDFSEQVLQQELDKLKVLNGTITKDYAQAYEKLLHCFERLQVASHNYYQSTEKK